jgi:hypothetical protein
MLSLLPWEPHNKKKKNKMKRLKPGDCQLPQFRREEVEISWTPVKHLLEFGERILATHSALKWNHVASSPFDRSTTAAAERPFGRK